MTTPEFLSPARTLLTGRSMIESARWHDGRLWFADWGAGEVVAVDLDGNAEVMAADPRRMGWSLGLVIILAVGLSSHLVSRRVASWSAPR